MMTKRTIDQELLLHYEQVQGKIGEIISGKEQNNQVVAPDFLDPTVCASNLPWTDPRGEFAYYFQIRTAWEYALVKGEIPADKFEPVLRRAPGEVKRDLSDRSITDLFV